MKSGVFPQKIGERASEKRFGAAFTLVEIMIVVAIIGLLAAIAIPNMIKARERAQLTAVQNNLRLIDSAKDQWALEQRKGTGEPVPSIDTITNYLKNGAVKVVVGETYTPNPVGTLPFATAPVKLGTYAAGTPIPAPPE